MENIILNLISYNLSILSYYVLGGKNQNRFNPHIVIEFHNNISILNLPSSMQNTVSIQIMMPKRPVP